MRWRVEDKLFVWERPPRKPDLADGAGVFFTPPHFDGYPAILVQLDRIGAEAAGASLLPISRCPRASPAA